MTRFLTLIMALVAMLTLTSSAFASRMQDSQRWVSCAATFSATGSGCVTDVRDMPMKNFAIQDYSSFDSSTTYTILLEGSLDGSSYTTLLTRASTSPNTVTWSSAASPVRYLRLRASALAANKTVSARFQAIQ
jgi:hypothetical protein